MNFPSKTFLFFSHRVSSSAFDRLGYAPCFNRSVESSGNTKNGNKYLAWASRLRARWSKSNLPY